MSWALVGRAESSEAAALGGTGYDVYGLLVVHALLIAPVVGGSVFGLLATVWLLAKAALMRSADAIAFAAHQTAALAAHNKERRRRKTVAERKKKEEEKIAKDAVLAAKYLAKCRAKKDKKKKRRKQEKIKKIKSKSKRKLKAKSKRGKKRRRRATVVVKKSKGGELATVSEGGASGAWETESAKHRKEMAKRRSKKTMERRRTKTDVLDDSDFDSIDSFSTSSEDEATHEHHHHHHHGRHHLLGGTAGTAPRSRHNSHVRRQLLTAVRTMAWAHRARTFVHSSAAAGGRASSRKPSSAQKTSKRKDALPAGWVAAESRSCPGQIVWKNALTGEKIGWRPKHPAHAEVGRSRDLFRWEEGGGTAPSRALPLDHQQDEDATNATGDMLQEGLTQRKGQKRKAQRKAVDRRRTPDDAGEAGRMKPVRRRSVTMSKAEMDERMKEQAEMDALDMDALVRGSWIKAD